MNSNCSSTSNRSWPSKGRSLAKLGTRGGFAMAVSTVFFSSACSPADNSESSTSESSVGQPSSSEDNSGSVGAEESSGENDASNDTSGDSQDSDSDSGDDGEFAGACPSIERLGGFEVSLEAENYSSVYGTIKSGVVPTSVEEVLFEEGLCRVIKYANPFCDPPCVGAQTCGLDGNCIPYPTAQSVGTVTVSGLVKAVKIEPNSENSYVELDLPYPVFEPNAKIEILGVGASLPAFQLDGLGFDILPEISTVWRLEQGKPLSISWTASTSQVSPPPEIFFGFSIDQHGLSPQEVVCNVPDTGSFEVSAALVDKLLSAGISGFPNAFMVRRIVDSQRIDGAVKGCIDFRVESKRIPQVEIVGHIPCLTDEDCPDGLSCNLLTETCEEV